MTSTNANTNTNTEGMTTIDFQKMSSSSIGSLLQQVEEQVKLLETKEKRWAKQEEKLNRTSSSVIKLNVGGQYFMTTKSTMVKYSGSLFATMMLSENWKPEDDGAYFIDRSPTLFPLILDFLRTGKLDASSCSQEDLESELAFYEIDLPGGWFNFPQSILLTYEQKKLVNGWVDNVGSKAKLLYRASRDGFRSTRFHSACDGKGPTVVVIKSGNYVFGGFAPIAWDMSGQFRASPQAFIFTLVNPHNIHSTKFVPIAGNVSQTYCVAGCGPIFGANDITIGGDENNCSFGFPKSYTDTTGRGPELFTGNKNFVPDDIEVFHVPY